MKILSPAGNFESLKMAVYNGADEVYLGINEFNARNNIDGFNLDSLKEAVDFAHVFGVKVHMAINILFADSEIQSALDTLVDAYNLGVDAFIIQDLGLAKLVAQNYPEIEIHASTQMGLHNLEGVKAVEKYGFKRVVLARETPLKEIKRIKENCDVEIEYFAQGALCVCFSGNCYLSSYLCNASGNRGRCKQLCRLPYKLEKDGEVIKKGYLLSAKDFNMIDRIDDLKSAGVDAIKIEGRARRPFYVSVATREYYNAIHGKKTQEDDLKLAFNREYTAGYFDGNGNIISEFNNHIGIRIGAVEEVSHGKKFDEVFISSDRKLFPKSTFKIFSNGQEKTTLTAYDIQEVKKGQYKLTTTQKVAVGDCVNLIVDAKLEEEVLKATKRREIEINLYAEKGKLIRAELEIEGEKVVVCGELLQEANNQPLSIDDIAGNFNKNELFSASVNVCKLDKVFMTKKQLNEFRRTVFAKAFEVLTEKHRRNKNKIKIGADYKIIKFDAFQIVENSNEKLVAQNIVYSPSFYNLEDIKQFQERCKLQKKECYLDTPNFALEADIVLLKEIIKETNVKIVANNYYALGFDTEIVIGAGLNVYNHFTAREYDKPIITAESDISTKINFPYMTLRHCPMKSHLGAKCPQGPCPYTEGFSYRMDNGKCLKLKRKKLSSCTFYLTD